MIGSHPRAQLIPPGTAIGRAAPGTAAGLPVVLVGGRLLGVWQREQKGKRLRITVDAHAPLDRRQKAALADQAERVAEILESKSDVEFGSLPLRFHL